MADVPLIRQADFHCGPASLAMVMQWSGQDVTQAEIARQSFTPGARGTYLADMLGAARRHGQIAVTLGTFPALLAELEAGHPVIVFQNLGLPIAPVWHYGVVVGYDLDREVVTLHSGQRDVMRMPLRAFLKSWDGGDRWAMVMLPADQHPARANETTLLRAAAALERVGQFTAAETAYRRGAARWPESWLWPFGLGNALYGQGEVAAARRAFRQALTLDPTAQAARNNLAQIDDEQGA
ncbi:PA2778 family cysteine peptidase [Roseovarius sp. D22-M7]|uniref:PA2778 family cysteine peptidase n=1 Tax=Roseovarius sp. D22-M7 TaxID=3127116 RepID=UPI003010517D